jgi:hypothetical protein
MVVITKPKKGVGLLRERACRWHQRCSFASNGDFGTSRLGDYILRDLVPAKQVVRPERLTFRLEARTTLAVFIRFDGLFAGKVVIGLNQSLLRP